MIKRVTTLVLIFVTIFSLLAQEFESGSIGISINNFGRIRIHSPEVDANVQIDRFSIMAGVARDQVFDYRNDGGTIDSAVVIENPAGSDFELYVKTDNSFSGLPPKFESAMKVYGWNGGAYALAKYEITNKEADNLETTFGFEILPQIDGAYGLESIKYVSSSKIIQIQQSAFSTKVGFKILSHNISSLKSLDWFEEYELGDTLLWDWLTSGNINNSYSSGADGSVNVVGLSPQTVALDETTEIWVGICVGSTDTDIINNMNAAESKYQTLTDVKLIDGLVPENYDLVQNYPNPFNPVTNIEFTIKERGFISLTIFDALGRAVNKLVHEELSAGNYSFKFDASDLPSGIYYYNLTTDKFNKTKKMVLLK